MNYEKDDTIAFKIGQKTLTYRVSHIDNTWFLSGQNCLNYKIFDLLDIKNPLKFVSNISEYTIRSPNAIFPEIEYPDATEINKVIDALLEKCNEYNKQFDNATLLCYKSGDQITFELPDIQYNYWVLHTLNGDGWYLSTSINNLYPNDQIFEDLNITNPKQFCRDVSGCDVSWGRFPIIKCPDSTGISKVINKLMEMCEEKIKKSLNTEKEVSTETNSQKSSSKVGDHVKVISKEIVLKESTPKYKLKFTN